MNRRIMYTTFLRGEAPRSVLRDMIRGNKPLLGFAGVGVTMGMPWMWSQGDVKKERYQ
jgi:hypothetical protein